MGETDMITQVLNKVAQRIVYCNCATEGPALKKCEHVSLAEQLERELGPMLRAGEDMRFQEWPPGMSFGPAKDWDDALATAVRG